MTTPTPDLPKAEHVYTDRCGFDRNGSHSAGHYVCACGWSDPLPVEHMDIPAMLRSSAPAAPEGEPEAVTCVRRLAACRPPIANSLMYTGVLAYIDHLRAALAEARNLIAVQADNVRRERERCDEAESHAGRLREICEDRFQSMTEQYKRADAASREAAEMRRALTELLDALEVEARAKHSAKVAQENFTDPNPELNALCDAMVHASDAARDARAALSRSGRDEG